MTRGFVIWLTGLPSSGKTTLSMALASSLREQGLSVEVLDGDELRQSLSADLGFSAKDRQEHARRVICLSRLLRIRGNWKMEALLMSSDDLLNGLVGWDVVGLSSAAAIALAIVATVACGDQR